MANNNDKKVLNVPALRFPEFTGEWKKCKLSKVCSFFSGGTPPSSNKEYYNGNIPFIRSGELHNDETELFITKEGLDNSAAKMVEVGDLLLALYGATSGDIAISKIKGAINQAILCIRTKQNKKFVESVWNKHVARLLQTYLQGGQGNLSADIVKNISFYFTNIEEQNKLARFISLLDQRLAAQNKIIEDLKRLKSAIYQELFSNLQGEEKSLSELAEITKGQQVNGNQLSENGKYYVMNGGIMPSGYYDDYNTEAGTISISEGGNSCGYVQYNKSEFWSGGHCYTLHIKPTARISTLFLFHFLKWKEEYIMALRIGSSLPNIQKKDLSKVRIIVPTFDKQQQLIALLSTLQMKIEYEEMYTINLDKQKLHLLSHMFI